MTYEILLRGHLSPSMEAQFEPMNAVNVAEGCTMLRGDLPDQASLFGLITRIRDLNIEVVELRQIQE